MNGSQLGETQGAVARLVSVANSHAEEPFGVQAMSSKQKSTKVPNPYLSLVGTRKVRVNAHGIYRFNKSWPCSELRSDRAYWFEFEDNKDLIDTNVSEIDDGRAASSVADDCRSWLFDDIEPQWSR